MGTKEYKGKLLRVMYPDFLRVRYREPDWYASTAGDRVTVTLNLDPPWHVADAYERKLRAPIPKPEKDTSDDIAEESFMDKAVPPPAEVTLIREGEFRTSNGLVGYENLTRVTDPVLRRRYWSWGVAGKLRGHNIMITIIADETYWHGGTPWEEFLNSIKLRGDLMPSPEPNEPKTDTTSKQYNGQILRIAYPATLNVLKEEPDWNAAGAAGQAFILVSVDPPGEQAEAMFAPIGTPEFGGIPQDTIVREGKFTTPNGLVGRERLLQQVNGVGQVIWEWFVEGTMADHTLTAFISAADPVWENDAPWRNMLNSIVVEVEGDAQQLREHRRQKMRQNPGALAQLPANLNYLLEAIYEANETDADPKSLEDHPEIFDTVVQCIEKQYGELSRAEIRERIQADHEQLDQWIRKHPMEKFPETRGAEWVANVLYAITHPYGGDSF